MRSCCHACSLESAALDLLKQLERKPIGGERLSLAAQEPKLRPRTATGWRPTQIKLIHARTWLTPSTPNTHQVKQCSISRKLFRENVLKQLEFSRRSAAQNSILSKLS